MYLDARDGEALTPIHLAYQNGTTCIIDCLLENGLEEKLRLSTACFIPLARIRNH